MKFIPYLDEYGTEHFFDASRVMFTMPQPLDHPDENGVHHHIGTKVALNENMGFIITPEPPADIIARIKEANGIAS